MKIHSRVRGRFTLTAEQTTGYGVGLLVDRDALGVIVGRWLLAVEW